MAIFEANYTFIKTCRVLQSNPKSSKVRYFVFPAIFLSIVKYLAVGCVATWAPLAYAQESINELNKRFVSRNYDELRTFLIANGWVPAKGGGYGSFNEVLCGTRGDCVGLWSKSRGREYVVSIDGSSKPPTVQGIESKQVISSDNQGQLIGSYCLGNFSNVSASRVSGDLSGLEINVKSNEIEVVVAEGDLIGTKVKDFTVTGNQLRFRFWDSEFVGECGSNGVVRKTFNAARKRPESQTLSRKTVLLANRTSIKWEDSAGSSMAKDIPQPPAKEKQQSPAQRVSSETDKYIFLQADKKWDLFFKKSDAISEGGTFKFYIGLDYKIPNVIKQGSRVNSEETLFEYHCYENQIRKWFMTYYSDRGFKGRTAHYPIDLEWANADLDPVGSELKPRLRTICNGIVAPSTKEKAAGAVTGKEKPITMQLDRSDFNSACDAWARTFPKSLFQFGVTTEQMCACHSDNVTRIGKHQGLDLFPAYIAVAAGMSRGTIRDIKEAMMDPTLMKSAGGFSALNLVIGMMGQMMLVCSVS